MGFSLERIDDKVEFFEGFSLKDLEKQIQVQIDNNRALMLQVHNVQHQVLTNEKTGRPYYSAVVHFKAK
ncbi:YrzA family protein [Guptibacillus algicola]|uniref:YrzA family protein n=1 Tax=Guptibacillus algicola TaxID=225844 RepID=UPI001CD20FAC|nr:YrzA family protein [Alkalihalobacillus algicola]MCA0986151.1 YrzA family protein [Alkalihalobacillus algicola]